ncbi:hypothetical protein OM076_19120 [Solirubrobacter ginsenosidimutans]|uniref:Uncharacterized protein n=1 Tax=Solirubrobacter ginsenosidimutans TaxID=490573 RepID=A0A9X3S2L1_9ACTN|nr:hypothetical protein [Solirubrobacter ginsenosidimutans]MDA0162392.1 hypothetical protein [Solirubrobacter ginsenosidimutans]
MATQKLADLARSAPGAARGLRPITTWREDMTTMAIGVWPITAMFFDGRGHNNKTGQESFFSIAHLFLYAGLTVLGIWVGVLVTRYQGLEHRKTLMPDLSLIPVGYGVAILGLITLAIGGPTDFIWHSAYGFEVGVDAIYSPPHLALFFGGLLLCSTGIRSMWAKQDIALDFKRFLPVSVSTTLFIGVAGFITMYLSAFMTNVTPTSDFVHDYQTHFKDDFSDQTISLNGGLTGYGDDQWPYYYYSASHGMASMIITTLVLFGPILLNMRRWRVPFGATTMIFTGYGLLVNIMTEYRDIVLIIPLIVTGLAIDVMARRLGGAREDGRVSLGGIRTIGPVAALILWVTYYAVLALDKGIGWEPTLWVGALIIGTMTGFAVAFLVAPPSYGPRLVEADN